MTDTKTPPRPRVVKLPSRGGATRHRVAKGFLALTGALALLVGVPVALVLLVGNPLPTTAPSRDWLTAEVTAELVINVLAVLVWVVWVHFLVCFLTEWRAVRAGRMPDRVLLGGGGCAECGQQAQHERFRAQLPGAWRPQGNGRASVHGRALAVRHAFSHSSSSCPEGANR